MKFQLLIKNIMLKNKVFFLPKSQMLYLSRKNVKMPTFVEFSMKKVFITSGIKQHNPRRSSIIRLNCVSYTKTIFYTPIEIECSGSVLGPSINGLVTDGNTKLCCRGFILALFQSTTANKIDSEHTRDYKRLFPLCEAEILRVTVKRIEVF